MKEKKKVRGKDRKVFKVGPGESILHNTMGLPDGSIEQFRICLEPGGLISKFTPVEPETEPEAPTEEPKQNVPQVIVVTAQ